MPEPSPRTPCAKCGEPLGAWEPLTAAGAPVRHGRAAVVVARACTECNAVELRARPAPAAAARPPRTGAGATVLHGFLSNVGEAAAAILRAVRSRLR